MKPNVATVVVLCAFWLIFIVAAKILSTIIAYYEIVFYLCVV